MLRLIAVSLLALAACEGAKAQPAPSPATGAHPQPAQASTDPSPSDQALCVAVMTHARSCTAVFIPALVDARAAADIPAGIKAAVAEDRNAVIAKANQEWATDSTDAAFAAQCKKPLPHAEDYRTAATTCQASTDCNAFTHCFIALVQQSWASR